MNIKQKLLRVQAAIIVDKAKGGGQLADLLGQAAEKAIIGGMTSDDWKAYMSLFADSKEQLTRLTTTDLDGTSPNSKWLPRARAYMVSNAICSPATDAATGKGLGTDGVADIDLKKPDTNELDETPDPEVVALRPFVIPDI